MSITAQTPVSQTACPDWCQSTHGAEVPETIRYLYTSHLRNLGGVGASWVSAHDPGDGGPGTVSLSTFKNDEHTTLDLTPDEALALARIYDDVESDNAATLAHALREAAALVVVPATV